MSPLNVGIVRYASVAAAIERAIGGEPSPQCRIGQGRIMLTFRRRGATQWTEAQQMEHALHAAAVARAALAADLRRAVHQRAERAIVVIYEDIALVRGYSVTARWECVVPAP